jgi:hypothetical protein
MTASRLLPRRTPGDGSLHREWLMRMTHALHRANGRVILTARSDAGLMFASIQQRDEVAMQPLPPPLCLPPAVNTAAAAASSNCDINCDVDDTTDDGASRRTFAPPVGRRLELSTERIDVIASTQLRRQWSHHGTRSRPVAQLQSTSTSTFTSLGVQFNQLTARANGGRRGGAVAAAAAVTFDVCSSSDTDADADAAAAAGAAAAVAGGRAQRLRSSVHHRIRAAATAARRRGRASGATRDATETGRCVDPEDADSQPQWSSWSDEASDGRQISGGKGGVGGAAGAGGLMEDQ